MPAAQLSALHAELSTAYQALQQENLNLDITRGKPAVAQVSLSDQLDGILDNNYISDSGIDTRNYGNLRGLPEACKLGSDVLNIPSSQIVSGGNSSLSLMHMAALLQYLHGVDGANNNQTAKPWQTLDNPTFICPVPGYDRHFSICKSFGIDMITVPMLDSGPDMDAVEALIKENNQIVGMWCVPRFSNPTGVTYRDDTVKRIAQLGTIAQPYFRVFWDNAYAVHTLETDAAPLASLWEACEEFGTQNSIWQFASTSKVTFAGAGIAWVASSDENLAAFEKLLGITTIGADKVNQLRHMRLFPDMSALTQHMQKHADSLKPKFDIVFNTLAKELSDYGTWTDTQGGYFISFDSDAGLANRIVKLAADAGLKLTPAGATYPYGKDLEDRNIRIAPSFPSEDELKKAMEIFTVCVKLATVEQVVAS